MEIKSAFPRLQAQTARTAVFAAAIVLAGAVSFDPHVLIVDYLSGAQERIPATSADTCRAAIAAFRGGRWVIADPESITGLRCEPGDIFTAGSTCIVGFNCPAGGAR